MPAVTIEVRQTDVREEKGDTGGCKDWIFGVKGAGGVVHAKGWNTGLSLVEATITAITTSSGVSENRSANVFEDLLGFLTKHALLRTMPLLLGPSVCQHFIGRLWG